VSYETTSSYQVLVKELEPTTVVRKRIVTSLARIADEIQSAVRELTDTASASHLEPAGAAEVTYLGDYQPWLDTESPVRAEIEVCIPVAGAIERGADRLPIGIPTGLPDRVVARPGQLVAHTFHHGPYDHIARAYRALFSWIDSAGYRVAGPPTERYLVGPDQTPKPANYLTEVVIPVAT
jgi:effector-binding domain-containing protein